MKKFIKTTTLVALLAIVFSIGFVCGQISEAAYRFRSMTSDWMFFPIVIKAVQRGKLDPEPITKQAIRRIEIEKQFLQNPFSIYPHPPQEDEMMPGRIEWLNGVIKDLKRPDVNITENPESESEDIITPEFLSEHGFIESEGGTGIFSLTNVRLCDAASDLGFPLAKLRTIPNSGGGTDIRKIQIKNLKFIVRAHLKTTDGRKVSDSLDDPDAICTISVALHQITAERKLTPEPGQ